MDECQNEEIGHLITFYETGLLSLRDRQRFEDHALDCAFCLSELKRLNATMNSLEAYKQDLRENLRYKGISFEHERQILLEQAGEERTVLATLSEKIRAFWGGIWGDRTLIPALAVTAAVVLLLIFLPPPAPDSPYLPFLSFEKAPYLSLEGTRVSQAQIERHFSEGMRSYQAGHFKEAIRQLKKAAVENPKHAKTWLYLGISYYLDRRPDPAIEALRKAIPLLDNVQQNRAAWYMAQAYLLKEDVVSSARLLKNLSDQGMEYSKEAKELLTHIRTIAPDLVPP